MLKTTQIIVRYQNSSDSDRRVDNWTEWQRYMHGKNLTVGEAKEILKDAKFLLLGCFMVRFDHNYITKKEPTKEIRTIKIKKLFQKGFIMEDKDTKEKSVKSYPWADIHINKILDFTNEIPTSLPLMHELVSDFSREDDRIEALIGQQQQNEIGNLWSASLMLINNLYIDINRFIEIMKHYDYEANKPNLLLVGTRRMCLSDYLDLNEEIIENEDYIKVQHFEYAGDLAIEGFNKYSLVILDLMCRLNIALFILEDEIEGTYPIANKDLINTVDDFRVIFKRGFHWKRIM